jgi:hypothetical protein
MRLEVVPGDVRSSPCERNAGLTEPGARVPGDALEELVGLVETILPQPKVGEAENGLMREPSGGSLEQIGAPRSSSSAAFQSPRWTSTAA